MTALTENELSNVIIGAAIELHKELGGPRLLEDIYEEALCYELSLRSIPVQRQVGLPVVYKGRELRKRLVLDVLSSYWRRSDRSLKSRQSSNTTRSLKHSCSPIFV